MTSTYPTTPSPPTPLPGAPDSPAAENHSPEAAAKDQCSENAPFPRSRKVYVRGTIHPQVRVPMREISLTPAKTDKGPAEQGPPNKNPTITVYDSSGPYTDPEIRVDRRKGVLPLRLGWITARGDVETYAGRTVKPEDDGYRPSDQPVEIDRFPMSSRRPPLRGKPGANVTQLHYARRGIVTPEMEFVAIREINDARTLPG